MCDMKRVNWYSPAVTTNFSFKIVPKAEVASNNEKGGILETCTNKMGTSSP